MQKSQEMEHNGMEWNGMYIVLVVSIILNPPPPQLYHLNKDISHESNINMSNICYIGVKLKILFTHREKYEGQSKITESCQISQKL